MEKKPTAYSGQFLRRPASVRIRTAAAGSFLAAASAAGLGTAGAPPARAAESSPVATPDAGNPRTAHAQGTQERLAGIRADLLNAVQWGSVTQTQADGFYAQLEARILRGL
ncbi:hypothetical protein LJ753_09020 [Arthrobacter sp. zg-Y20]|uniref:hypothetical protein n=1 Tax=unclassified Arthrobacter TaxID=235627 RepID=UPI001D145588|nr:MULTISPECIES: hypothetical protein [unclassified Arthrobacter]MCC3276013.1 hypothetical protein [Arthrobacter sp. zg-Y20]MDK1316170.1 hypothetical protein [Arthrobacter sp. zg.Y20]WIB05548.1 hypothetical protein QNO06_13585 [Arthrobacter sp. zg-Y20]